MARITPHFNGTFKNLKVEHEPGEIPLLKTERKGWASDEVREAGNLTSSTLESLMREVTDQFQVQAATTIGQPQMVASLGSAQALDPNAPQWLGPTPMDRTVYTPVELKLTSDDPSQEQAADTWLRQALKDKGIHSLYFDT